VSQTSQLTKDSSFSGRHPRASGEELTPTSTASPTKSRSGELSDPTKSAGGYQKPPKARPHIPQEDSLARPFSVAESPRNRVRPSAELTTKPSKYPHPRPFITVNSKIGDKMAIIRVLQFNMLADGLSALDKDHGDLCRVSKDVIDWEYRKNLILNEIVQYSPDIITLQEIDHYFDFFLPEMSRRGYTSYFAPKPRSPCLEVSTRADGSAIFINSKTLSCISSFSFTYAIDENLEPEAEYYSVNTKYSDGRVVSRYVYL
jgi:hypothetical protein